MGKVYNEADEQFYKWMAKRAKDVESKEKKAELRAAVKLRKHLAAEREAERIRAENADCLEAKLNLILREYGMEEVGYGGISNVEYLDMLRILIKGIVIDCRPVEDFAVFAEIYDFFGWGQK